MVILMLEQARSLYRPRVAGLLLGAALVVTPNVVSAAQGGAADPLAMGRLYTDWLYSGELDRLWERFSGVMREAMQHVDTLAALRVGILEQLGAETELVEEQVTPLLGDHLYIRTAAFEAYDGNIVLQWTIDAAGDISGFFIRPTPVAAPTDYLEYETKTPLRLPFDGEWYVFWGGRTVAQNYHAVAIDQRFAYDILVVRENRSHAREGTVNADYYCFRTPILAPAPGVVVGAEDGVPDNTPGVVDSDRPLGNHVIIDHGNGEFSFLAHFLNGSVAVENGDDVSAGDLLGLCGNSGNTSEPHLHYHLQTTAVFGGGEGLPAQFLGYLADGQPVARGEPVRGQKIRSQE